MRPMEFFAPGQAQFRKGTYHAPIQPGYSFEQQMPMGGGNFGNFFHVGMNTQHNGQGSGQNNAGSVLYMLVLGLVVVLILLMVDLL